MSTNERAVIKLNDGEEPASINNLSLAPGVRVSAPIIVLPDTLNIFVTNTSSEFNSIPPVTSVIILIPLATLWGFEIINLSSMLAILPN